MASFPYCFLYSYIVGRAITLEGEPSKRKQRTDKKKDGKRIKSDNFTRSNILVVAFIYSPTVEIASGMQSQF